MRDRGRAVGRPDPARISQVEVVPIDSHNGGNRSMPKTIQQSVTLPAPAGDLYRTYLDPKRHAAITGTPVKIGARPGSPFRAFNGALSGKMLFTRPEQMIVQTWRSTGFGRKDLDSILVLTFWPRGKSGRVRLVHVNVADRDARGVTEGWKKYYWRPWRAYLRRRRRSK
jgi:activator of HSP90 ATPase